MENSYKTIFYFLDFFFVEEEMLEMFWLILTSSTFVLLGYLERDYKNVTISSLLGVLIILIDPQSWNFKGGNIPYLAFGIRRSYSE